jgi:hypothetical protein
MPPVDRYTKALLTIIAGALVYIAAMLSGERAQAQAQAGEISVRPQPVVIVGWEAAFPRPVPVAIQYVPEPLPVTLSGVPSQPWPVTLTGVRAGSPWDEVRVRMEQRPTSTPGIP